MQFILKVLYLEWYILYFIIVLSTLGNKNRNIYAD